MGLTASLDSQSHNLTSPLLKNLAKLWPAEDAVGTLEQFVSPILLQTVLDLKKGQQGQDKKLDQIILLLQQKVSASPAAPSPTLPHSYCARHFEGACKAGD